MSHQHSVHSIDRRTLLRGTAGVLGVLAVGSVPATASGGLGFTNVGVNTFEFGEDSVEVFADKTPAPEIGGAATYVHSEPQGTGTDDYLTTVGNVDDEGITLGDFAGSNPATLRYDYYGGANNAITAPDEVWLRLVESDGTEHEVYRTGNDGAPSAQVWKTRDVGKEIRGNPDTNPGFNWFEVSSSGNVNRLSERLLDDFASDTEVNRVGAGRGTPSSGGDVLDIYYRALRFDGDRVSTFPTGSGPGGGPGRGGP